MLQGAVVGTHRLPYGIAEVYGKAFYNGNEVRPSAPAGIQPGETSPCAG